MKTRHLLIGIALTLAPTASALAAAPMPHRMVEMPTKESRAAFADAMRNLWEQHVFWTRLYVVSALAGLPDKDATANRLLQNQEDLGDAIKPYFGIVAGDKLHALLKEHILIAVAIIDAAKAKESAALTGAKARWYANADEIAAFLSAADPKGCPPEHTKTMMREHLDLTLSAVTARLEARYADEVAAFDKIEAAALMMADMLSAGIIKKMPSKFAKSTIVRSHP